MTRLHHALLPLLLLLPGALCSGQERPPLRVGTKPALPFSFQEDGRWTGLSIELWERVREGLDFDVGSEYVDGKSVEGLLDAIREGRVDVAVAALTVTADRERALDFTHPVLSSGLGIATRVSESGGLWAVVRGLLSWEFLSLVFLLLALLGVVGAVLWLFERRRNAQQFGGTLARGLGAGLWWSAVTMTTVGYGDKAPTTFGGRAIALVWMFASILIISTFTAAIASSLTVRQLEGAIQSPEDLPGARIGSVRGTTSSAWLDDQLLRYRAFPTVDAALSDLAAEKLDAVVYDAPILEYLAHRQFSGLHVLPHRLARQDYAFAVRKDDHALRKAINQELLQILVSEEWERLLTKYFGRP